MTDVRPVKVFSTKILLGGVGQTVCIWEERSDLVLSCTEMFNNRKERFPTAKYILHIHRGMQVIFN